MGRRRGRGERGASASERARESVRDKGTKTRPIARSKPTATSSMDDNRPLPGTLSSGYPRQFTFYSLVDQGVFI